jgi:hypothetical protein
MDSAQFDSLDVMIRERFRGAGVGLYHADNLSEAAAQIAHQQIMSRERLRGLLGHGFTPFESDHDDEVMGVIDRTFGNPRDMGELFTKYKRTTPAVYGPIMFRFKPDAYGSMTDIKIVKKSVVNYKSLGANWVREAASSEGEIDSFVEEHLRDYRSKDGVSFGSWTAAEVSCREPALSFEHIEAVVVEPITVLGVDLVDEVRAEAHRHGVGAPVVPRAYTAPRNLQALQELVSVCEAHVPEVRRRKKWTAIPVERLPLELQHDNGLYRVQQWCRYFIIGTIMQLEQRKLAPPTAAE